MKRFATSTILAGCLFAGLLGTAGTAHATDVGLGADSGTLTLTDSSTPNRELQAPGLVGNFGADSTYGSMPLGMGNAYGNPGGAGAGLGMPFGMVGMGFGF